MTASVSGRNFRVFWSTFFRSSGRLLLMAFQSFTTVGIYPCRPSAFSHRRAYTSSLPRKRLRNRAILCLARSSLSTGGDGLAVLVGGGFSAGSCGIAILCTARSRRRRAFSSRRRIFSCSGGSNGRESEPFSVIPRSPLRALCQHLFEELLNPRKHRSDICWKTAFRGQGLKRGLPIGWRRNQARKIVCPSSLEGQTQSFQNATLIQLT